MKDVDPGKAACCGLFSVLLLVSVILIGVSFGRIDPLHAGILLTYQKEVPDKVYSNGLHFIGFGNQFLKFPTNARTITFARCSWCPAIDEENPDESLQVDIKSRAPLSMWSAEGQNIEIEVSVRYHLERERLRDLYYRFGLDYHETFANIILQELKSAGVQFTTPDYFVKRRNISDLMESQCRAAFADNYAVFESLQLRSVEVPEGFNNKVIDKVVAEERVRTESQLQKVQLVQANISVVVQGAAANATLVLTEANGEGIELIAAARASARRNVTAASAKAYSSLAEQLNMTASELRTYVWTRTWKQRTLDGKGTVITGFSSPIVQA